MKGYVCPYCGPEANATFEEDCDACGHPLWLDLPAWLPALILAELTQLDRDGSPQPTRAQIEAHRLGVWLCKLPQALHTGRIEPDSDGIPWFSTERSSFPLQPTGGRRCPDGARFWPLTDDGDKVRFADLEGGAG